MKSFSKLGTVALLAVVALAAGCKKGPKNITPLPGYSGTAVPGNIGTSQPITPITTPAVTTPIYTGNGANGQPGSGRPLIDETANTAPVDLSGGKGKGELVGQVDREVVDGMVADRETFKGNTVYFDFDKSAIKPDQKANVAAVAEYLKGHGDNRVVVEGHTDERGTEEYNRALGERRALSVRETLLNLGIPADRVITRSFGEDKPAELGHDEAAWGKNRRGEFILLVPPTSVR
jgi:peptidoglycan-associated lipoprotein